MTTVVMFVVGALALLVLSVLLSKAIVRAIAGLTTKMTRLAHNDFDVDINEVNRADEIGEMAGRFWCSVKTVLNVSSLKPPSARRMNAAVNVWKPRSGISASLIRRWWLSWPRLAVPLTSCIKCQMCCAKVRILRQTSPWRCHRDRGSIGECTACRDGGDRACGIHQRDFRSGQRNIEHGAIRDRACAPYQ
ncbi:HAMP domain-containing protein [Thalassospira permensis]|uniref:HAMP domain-containing protein n=1 Tax=Thalassospira TaxID=168934 RepID=UPI0030B80176